MPNSHLDSYSTVEVLLHVRNIILDSGFTTFDSILFVRSRKVVSGENLCDGKRLYILWNIGCFSVVVDFFFGFSVLILNVFFLVLGGIEAGETS